VGEQCRGVHLCSLSPSFSSPHMPCRREDSPPSPSSIPFPLSHTFPPVCAAALTPLPTLSCAHSRLVRSLPALSHSSSLPCPLLLGPYSYRVPRAPGLSLYSPSLLPSPPRSFRRAIKKTWAVRDPGALETGRAAGGIRGECAASLCAQAVWLHELCDVCVCVCVCMCVCDCVCACVCVCARACVRVLLWYDGTVWPHEQCGREYIYICNWNSYAV